VYQTSSYRYGGGGAPYGGEGEGVVNVVDSLEGKGVRAEEQACVKAQEAYSYIGRRGVRGRGWVRKEDPPQQLL
jgi:hypothetical protein